MTRIVAGRARGRRLAVPPGDGTRPTADRVREALFSSLEAEFGALAGLRVLDLYAGSGALGLEALSRGAAHVLLVEAEHKAVRAITENVATVGLDGAVVQPARAEQVLAGTPAEPYDLVLADPPYALAGAAVTELLALLVDGWLATDALVVVERPRRAEPLAWPPGLVAQRERRYGETMLWYGRPAG
jgi:16S rRNA (guanine966-N2)-methyltransferase